MTTSTFIKDPIHGDIEFNKEEAWALQIINTPEFQRLLTIKQLGECSHIFYSANHTRFSHSIGVFHLAKAYLNALGITNQKERNVVLAAALLHDIGHGPRSHSFEWYTGLCHEEMTIKIITNVKGNIVPILKAAKIDIKEVISIINKTHKNKWMIQIVSSQIDADRLDYLLRDSYHSGVVYGKSVDYSFLFKKISIQNNQIVYDKKVVHLIETILFARYQMFKQLYTNIHVLAYEAIIKKVFNRFKVLSQKKFKFKDKFNLYYLFDGFLNDTTWNLDDFLTLNEEIYDLILISLSEENDPELKSLINYYFSNKNFALEVTNKKSESDYPLMEKLLYSPHKEPIMISDNKKLVEIDKISDFLKNFNNTAKEVNYKLIFTK